MGAAQDLLCLCSCSTALLPCCLCGVCWEPRAPLGKALPLLMGCSLAGLLAYVLPGVGLCTSPGGTSHSSCVPVFQTVHISERWLSLPTCPHQHPVNDTANMVRVFLVPSSDHSWRCYNVEPSTGPWGAPLETGCQPQ